MYGELPEQSVCDEIIQLVDRRMNNHMAKSVTFINFPSDDAAKAFIDWYEGQGEQDAEIWMGERGFNPSDFYVDMSGKTQETNDSFVVKLKGKTNE
jgi:hypothetical protein